MNRRSRFPLLPLPIGLIDPYNVRRQRRAAWRDPCSARGATRECVRCTPWCTPGMGASLWGASPLREVRILEPVAKDKGAPVRVGPEEVWSKPASPRTGTPYEAQPWGESAPHDEALLTGGRVNGGVVRGKRAHLIRGDLSGVGCPAARAARRAATFVGLRAGVSRGRSSWEGRESGWSEGPNGRTGRAPWQQRER
jgi:hypothetical protein